MHLLSNPQEYHTVPRYLHLLLQPVQQVQFHWEGGLVTARASMQLHLHVFHPVLKIVRKRVCLGYICIMSLYKPPLSCKCLPENGSFCMMLKSYPQYMCRERLMGTSPHQLFWGDQALTQERPLVVISKLLEDYRSQTDRQTDTQTDRQADSQPLTWYIINVLKFTFTILLR